MRNRLAFFLAIAVVGARAIAADVPKLPFVISKETTDLTGPLNADGTVDYVGAINAELSKGVTPENNGFVRWITLLDGKKFLPTAQGQKILEMCGAVNGNGLLKDMGEDLHISTDRAWTLEFVTTYKAAGQLWTADDYPLIAQYLDDMGAELDQVAYAGNRKKWWMPYVARVKPPLWTTVIPAVGKLRATGAALAARATLRGNGGSFMGFYFDAMAVRLLARHAAGWSLMEKFTGVEIEENGCNAMGAEIASGKLIQQDIGALRGGLSTLAPFPGLRDTLNRGERWNMLDLLQFLATTDETGWKDFGDIFPTYGSLDRSALDWNIVFRRANQLMDEHVATLDGDAIARQRGLTAFDKKMEALHKRVFPADVSPERLAGETDEAYEIRATAARKNTPFPAREKDETKEQYSQRMADVILSTIWPSVGHADLVMTRAQIKSQLVELLLTCAQYKVDKNKWPDQLDDLVPQYIAAVPGDPYDAEHGAMKYLVMTGGPVVYSVGANGKDDGGISDRHVKADDIAVGAGDSLP